MNTAIEYIRKNKNIFLRYGDPSNHELASKIVVDAVSKGCRSVKVDLYDNWVFISSPDSWFDLEKGHELFSNLVPNPEAGVNASRGEVVLSAFCNRVLLSNLGMIAYSSGDLCDAVVEELKNCYQNVFLIGFEI